MKMCLRNLLGPFISRNNKRSSLKCLLAWGVKNKPEIGRLEINLEIVIIQVVSKLRSQHHTT